MVAVIPQSCIYGYRIKIALLKPAGTEECSYLIFTANGFGIILIKIGKSLRPVCIHDL